MSTIQFTLRVPSELGSLASEITDTSANEGYQMTLSKANRAQVGKDAWSSILVKIADRTQAFNPIDCLDPEGAGEANNIITLLTSDRQMPNTDESFFRVTLPNYLNTSSQLVRQREFNFSCRDIHNLIRATIEEGDTNFWIGATVVEEIIFDMGYKEERLNEYRITNKGFEIVPRVSRTRVQSLAEMGGRLLTLNYPRLQRHFVATSSAEEEVHDDLRVSS